MKLIKPVVIGLSLLVIFDGRGFCQTNLNFNGVSATVEGAIRLSWNSTSNEVYRIEYANEIADTNTGTTPWFPLYTDYPSHGTNTFVADDGNYDPSPEIAHPKRSTMRFYRIALVETNTSPTNPIVAITWPTNGASLSAGVMVTVSAASSELLSEVKLYVDGEEQWSSGDGTNFFINTCEWPNGAHVLFATAKSQSSIEGFPYNNTITYGRAVSAYVNVTFDNLITRFDFSEPFFEPSEGQTQRVTAVFTANVDWTLAIQDAFSITLRFASGSGASMLFDWDGTGTNGATLPDGVYSYLLNVQTNGQQMMMSSEGAGFSSSALQAFAEGTETTELWAMPAGEAGSPVPLILYPPGFDTNSLNIFEATPLEVEILNKTIRVVASETKESLDLTLDSGSSGGGVMEAAYSSPTQNTRGPKRKPKVGVKNKAGTFGICYKTYPFGAASQQPRTGNPLQPFTGVDGGPRSSGYISWSILKSYKKFSGAFSEIMQAGAFKPQFVKADEDWGPQDIKKGSLGGSSIFNTCDFGMLMTHGVYGTFPEIDGVKYIYYFLFDQNNGTSYVRLSDMDFGSGATHGLKWMTLFACNSLYPANITSMANNSKLPGNSYLHLMLGHSTTTYSTPWLGFWYASNLVSNVTIKNSLVAAETKAFADQHAQYPAAMTNSVSVRVMGFQSCINDTLYLFNEPDPNTSYQIQDTPVFTP